ncbi:MAG: DUF5362 family protein [Rhodothermaceae bacterium]
MQFDMNDPQNFNENPMQDGNQRNPMLMMLINPLYQGKLWIKLLGIMSIIYGVISALTIFGLIIAWLPIWIGVTLFQASTAIEEAYLTQNQGAFLKALNKLKTYFTITGVLVLIGLILGGLGLLFGGMGILMGLAGMNGGY